MALTVGTDSLVTALIKTIITSRFVESEAPPRLYKLGPSPLILTIQVHFLRRPLPLSLLPLLLSAFPSLALRAQL